MRKFTTAGVVLVMAGAFGIFGFARWMGGRGALSWPDRRPVGVLFLADTSHASATNPRGWFNEPRLDVAGAEGAARFRKLLMALAGRSIALLRRAGAQGVIVWDIEGEQYPQKTSYIGDPRAVSRLAPEMGLAIDEFLGRFREAGFRIGLTIRPQRLVFDANGIPRQTEAAGWERVLGDKIDYSRRRWGATIFYLDSNAGIRQPGEWLRLQSVVAARPGVLLIPEHHQPLYRAFSAPYFRLQGRTPADTWQEAAGRALLPRSFEALNIADAAGEETVIRAARKRGDLLLFRAGFPSRESALLEQLAGEPEAGQSDR